jgi:hypothetical protein
MNGAAVAWQVVDEGHEMASLGEPVLPSEESRRSVAAQLPPVFVRTTTLLPLTARHVVSLGQSIPMDRRVPRGISCAGAGWPPLMTTKSGVLMGSGDVAGHASV